MISNKIQIILSCSAGVPPEFLHAWSKFGHKKIPRLLLGFPDNLLLLIKADYKYKIKYKAKLQTNVIIVAEIVIDLSLIA